LLVAAVIFGGDTQTLAGKTIFFQFSIPIGVHFFNFSLQFFQFCFFKIQKKNRAARDVRLAFKLAREQVSLLFFLNTFTLNFYFFHLSILYFFNRIFVNFIYSIFSFFDLTKVKTILLKISS
jgi:hypothetical protein